MKDKLKKIFTQKNRNILAIITIVLGTIFLIYYSFYTPSYINEYIATNIYKAPANSYFDDENFYNCVIDAYNSENKTSLPYTQSLTDTQLNSIKILNCRFRDISSTKGLEKMTSLTKLYAYYTQLTELDVSKNTALTSLSVDHNPLTKLDVSKNTALTYLSVGYNQLTELDVSKNTALTTLSVSSNKLTKLDVSKNTALTELYAQYNQLTELDVSKNTALTKLYVDHIQLTELDVSKNTALTYLGVWYNQLTELDVSKNTALTTLDVYNNPLTKLDVSKNTALTDLDVDHNQLTELDVSKNTALAYLNVSYNQLTELDVSKNTALTGLNVSSNQLTELDVSKNTALTTLRVYNNQLTELDVSKNTALTTLDVWDNQLTELDVSKNTALTDLNVGSNQLTELDVSKNTRLKYLAYEDNLFTKYYTLLDEEFTLDRGIILPTGWITSLSTKDTNILKIEDNKITPIKTGMGEALQAVYNSEKTLIKQYYKNDTYTGKCFIYVYNITSDTYIIDKDNIYINFDTDSEKILSNIEFDYGDVDGYTNYIENNKLIIKHNDKVIKEYNLIKLEVTSDNYFVEDNEIKYTTFLNKEFNLDNVNINYGTKEIVDNKLIIKHNGKVIKEYNLIKLEVNSNIYNINNNDIVYVNNLDLNKININYGTKEIVDNKLVIKYNDKVIKEYTLYKINSTYRVNKDTIFVDSDEEEMESNLNNCYSSCTNTANQTECADECDMKYTIEGIILSNVTSDDLELSVSDNKLVCKLNNNTIKIFNISNEKEYLDIIDYDKNDDKRIISKIVNGTNVDVFKNNILTNISYSIKDKDNNVITDRNLRTGDKIIFDNGIEYILSLIGDSSGDGKVDVDDVIKIVNHFVGKTSLEEVYLLSSDVNSDGQADVDDVIKIVNYFTKGSELK